MVNVDGCMNFFNKGNFNLIYIWGTFQWKVKILLLILISWGAYINRSVLSNSPSHLMNKTVCVLNWSVKEDWISRQNTTLLLSTSCLFSWATHTHNHIHLLLYWSLYPRMAWVNTLFWPAPKLNHSNWIWGNQGNDGCWTGSTITPFC